MEDVIDKLWWCVVVLLLVVEFVEGDFEFVEDVVVGFVNVWCL